MAEDFSSIEDPSRRQRRIPPRPRTSTFAPSPVRSSVSPVESDPELASSDTPSEGAPIEKEAAPLSPLVEVPEVGRRAAFSTDPTPSADATEAAPANLPTRSPAVEKPKRIPTRKQPGAKEGGTSIGGAALLLVLSAALVGYAFNVGDLQTSADAYFSGLNASSQNAASSLIPVFLQLLPWLLLLPILVLLYTILKTIASLIGLTKKKQKSQPLKAQDAVAEFKRAAHGIGVSSRVAYQAYLVLKPIHSSAVKPAFSARLEEDLQLAPAVIRQAHLQILQNADRIADSGARLPLVVTVADLLRAVEFAEQRPRAPQNPAPVPGDPGGVRPKIRT